MCHERYWQRYRQAEESRRMWMDFECTEPPAEHEMLDGEPEPETVEVREEVQTTASR
jgi:hypothetical protein